MKNRFCRNTKLTEDEFLFILAGFCAGMTATETAGHLAAMDKRVSRQSIEKKFLELGAYVYRKFTRHTMVTLLRELNPTLNWSDDAFETHALDRIWENLRGNLDYAGYRDAGLAYPGHGSMMAILQERWTLFNGFTRDKLPAHIGYAAYRDHANLNGGQEVYTMMTAHLAHDPL